MTELPKQIRTAPGVHGCCTAAGRMCAMAQAPLATERLIAMAVAYGDGSRGEIEQRIVDMLAAGMLIEHEG